MILNQSLFLTSPTGRRPVKVKVVILDTAPEGSMGSMKKYVRLVEDAFHNRENENKIIVKRISLALPSRILDLFPSFLRNRAHHLWIMATAWLRLFFCKADLFHITDGSHAYISFFLPWRPFITTAHDIIPFLQEKSLIGGSKQSRFGKGLVKRSLAGLKRSDWIVAVSKNTRKDMIENLGIAESKVDVIYSPISSEVMTKIATSGVIDWHHRAIQEGAFVLHVGNDAIYKNREGALRIFAAILGEKKSLRFKIAGAPPDAGLLKKVEQLGLKDQIDFIVDPDDDLLIELYRRACLFIFPSIYEGAGWPPLEAMACGCPVVCSSAASLPEMVGDAAILVPPQEEKLFAEKCIEVINNNSLAETIIKKGLERATAFNMNQFASQLSKIYRSIAKDVHESSN